MQFLAFGCCENPTAAAEAVQQSGLEAAVYLDVNDPRGLGVVTISEDPATFAGQARELWNAPPFDRLTVKPQYTMLGRTYSIGYEPDLEEALLNRPRRHALEPAWPWAVWYPLRRSGRFGQLPEEEQKAILAEHGTIGMSFGAGDFAHDVRLACHGLDAADNDFVIGLMGKDLYPLSALVQTMRKTQQTGLYLEHLGPFFVGKAIYQSPIGV